MAAQMINSALAQEAVNQVVSIFKERYEHKSGVNEHMERMEIAHIRLEAALETSYKWNVTSAPLLRWRSKLKRAAQECDHTLRRCRQHVQEEEEVQQRVRNSSFPKRIAHTARSFVSSIFSHGNNDKLSGFTAVRRFERFADGASEFLRYVEIGGTPRRYMFFDPLIRHLLAGKGTKYCSVHRDQHLSFVLQPFRTPEHGMEGSLTFLLEDATAPENNFLLILKLRLSESIDIVGVAVKCLQLFRPLLRSIVDTVKTKVTQVPTQDLCWVSDAHFVYGCYEHQNNNLSTICSKWFRPNLNCCQQQGHQYAQSYNASSSSLESLPRDIYLEPVLQVYVLGHIALSVGNNRQRAVVHGESKTSRRRNFPYLKIGAHFWPHTCFEDLSSADGGSATETINGVVLHHGSLYGNISFEQLGDIMLSKAVDCLSENVAATSYKMLRKSKHGGAYLQAEKISGRLTTRKGMGGKCPEGRHGKKVQGWASANNEFMNSWIDHAPAQLQGSVIDWVQKEKRLPPSLLLKSNPCVGSCPIKLLYSEYNRFVTRKIKSFSTYNAQGI